LLHVQNCLTYDNVVIYIFNVNCHSLCPSSAPSVFARVGLKCVVLLADLFQ